MINSNRSKKKIFKIINYRFSYLNCFKHRGLKPDGFEPETIEHKTMKDQLYNIIPKFNPIYRCEKEFWFDDQVADLYFETREDNQFELD